VYGRLVADRTLLVGLRYQLSARSHPTLHPLTAPPLAPQGARYPAPYRLVSGQGAGRPGAGRQVWRRGRTGLLSQRPNRPIAATSLALLASISRCSRADLGRSAW
jgi:hypothetical protein